MPYYFYDGKDTHGPFAPGDLLKRPGFGPASLVCPVGESAWKPASSFPDLSAPPPPPASKTPLSEITLTIPAPRKIVAEPPPAAAPVPAPAPAPAAAPAAGSPAEKTVLIVDDDDAVRSLLELTAQSGGFQVFTAVDGIEAAAAMDKRPADLIVTDLMMPRQGGFEFLRALQTQGRGRIPVFVVTGSALEPSTIALIKAEGNVVEFVAKPINSKRFVAALHQHLKTAPK